MTQKMVSFQLTGTIIGWPMWHTPPEKIPMVVSMVRAREKDVRLHLVRVIDHS